MSPRSQREPFLEPCVILEKSHDLSDFILQTESFIAVLGPVVVTILLSCLFACHIPDANTQSSMRAYLYYQHIDASGLDASTKIAQAFTNASLVILYIAAITCMVVVLYKFNCMRCLTGYLALSTVMLLGSAGSVVVKQVLVLQAGIHLDVVTFYTVMYNFAIVGTLSIFYQQGIPSLVEKSALIASSVIMAWQLSQWPEWSAWTILCLLALWDLFAVLTPYGPLNWLLQLMQQEERPMPGLLYSAQVVTLEDKPQTTWRSSSSDDSVSALTTQLQAFYLEYNPPNQRHASTLARAFQFHPQQLWTSLFTKYHLHQKTFSAPPMSPRIYPTPATLDQERSPPKEPHVIKLGLGDFIFYSVLVARGAMHGVQPMVSCLLGVVTGLGLTLVLLMRYHALPALPISILLGATLFTMTSVLLVPLLTPLITLGLVL